VFGTDKTGGTMDPLQQVIEVADLHEMGSRHGLMPPALGLVNSELESMTRPRFAAAGTVYDTRAVSRERIKAQLQRRPRLFDTVDHASPAAHRW